VPSLVDRLHPKIAGVLSCFDRVVIQGTLPGLCFADGMTRYLRDHDVRIFDYPRWAEPLREEIRANMERLAGEHGVAIEFVAKTHIRKETLVARVLAKRGDHPGLVHILSAMETCPSYYPWHDKTTGRTALRPKTGKCLHYYVYFIDEELGLCYLRVPTWCPFRLQVYFNGHNLLAAKLRAAGVGYKMLDNAFVDIDDFDRAQALADDLDVARLHATLDRYARWFCPVVDTLGQRYHWSIMQVEYATDVVFRRQSDLAPVYESISRAAVLAVKADNVATFLGRKLHPNYRDEVGNDFSTRVEGTRIRHHMGPASIKMYDKAGIVLRIETTANDVTFFKHHRTVEQKDGTRAFKLAPVRKTIYSFPDLRPLLAAANRRYLDFISDLEDPSIGQASLTRVTEPMIQAGRTYKGFNFFAKADLRLLELLARGEHAISGFRNKSLRRFLAGSTAGKVSRFLKRLRVHGLIKRVGRTYKYYLTELGRRAVAAALRVRQFILLPTLSEPAMA